MKDITHLPMTQNMDKWKLELPFVLQLRNLDVKASWIFWLLWMCQGKVSCEK